MNAKDLRDLVHFSEEGPHRQTLWEGVHLWSEVICLERGQQHGPVGDPASDGLCLVAAGRVVVQVGRSRRRLGQWETAPVPAGQELTLTNASEDPAVILLVAAPPPTAAS